MFWFWDPDSEIRDYRNNVTWNTDPGVSTIIHGRMLGPGIGHFLANSAGLRTAESGSFRL